MLRQFGLVSVAFLVFAIQPSAFAGDAPSSFSGKGAWIDLPVATELQMSKLARELKSRGVSNFEVHDLARINSLRGFSYRPELVSPWVCFDNLLSGPSVSLSNRDFLMIGAVVSTENLCRYCMSNLVPRLRDELKDKELTRAILETPESAAISPRERAMLAYAIKLTRTPDKIVKGDVDELRKSGWKDKEIFDIALVTATFNFKNRMSNGLGYDPDERHQYTR